jgi:hypothetical protein
MIGTPRKGGTIDPKAEIVRSFSVRLSLTSGRGLSPTDSNYRKRLVSASEENVSKLLRDTVTKTYLGKDGTWTPDSFLAKHFVSTIEAFKEAQLFRKKQLEIVLLYKDAPSQDDVLLPL